MIEIILSTDGLVQHGMSDSPEEPCLSMEDAHRSTTIYTSGHRRDVVTIKLDGQQAWALIAALQVDLAP